MRNIKKTAGLLLGVATVFFMLSCLSDNSSTDSGCINSSGSTLETRISVPNGYKRITAESASFASWTRKLKLKPAGTNVKLYDGSLKNRQDVHAAIIDLDCGTKNLQQCADAVIRLRAEYLFANNLTDKISFHYTSGDIITFSRWKKGERPVVSGNKVVWKKNNSPCSNYGCLKSYLWNVFTYAGTLSVEKETRAVKGIHEIQPGDIFVKGGSPGHAVTVIDVAINEKTGKKIFLLCQSYMPAQDIHILKNFSNTALSPWYNEDFEEELITPEWTFDKNSLRRY